MKRFVLLILAAACTGSATAAATPEAASAALWRGLSHAPGVAADTEALGRLFHPDSVVIGARYRGDTPTLSVDKGSDFIARLHQVRPTGFYECEMTREVKRQDRFATVYSVVESRTDPKAAKADFVGVNSIQLYQSEDGWKIVSLYYHVGKPDAPVPLEGGRSGVCLGDGA